ncbi:2Fe-2S iron-sulfur cluster-binding protein [Aquisalimonas sp. 2447]|uniref:2Fe-2S iron-sulfur cluster-binding protein n=1 Tax=Aquisalimonas sp. 2447 TaxID=2740807 RepID=UPI001C2C2CB5|nr:2Fe-2S iron-sulfur cluster-binding protein [Aquisalimonas sp. 2447]
MTETVSLTIDGRSVQVAAGTTIWDAAQELGIDIPVLCHSPRMRPVGVCRMCVVDTGARNLQAACVRPCEEGMEVRTDTGRVERNRRMLLELLLADYPRESLREQTTGDDELLALARAYGLEESRFGSDEAEAGAGRDDSSLVIVVDHQACILCDRCIRGCDELQHNHVMTRSGKGAATHIAFDLDVPMGESTCVACGECQAVCPTGALTNRSLHGLQIVEEETS